MSKLHATGMVPTRVWDFMGASWIGWDFAPGCFARFGSKRSHGQSFLRRADILALVRIVSGVA